MPFLNWDELEKVEFNPLVYGHIVQTDKAMVCKITCPVGKTMNMHKHDFDQITNMLSGKILWTIEGEGEKEVGPWDVLVMPAGVAHGGVVIEEATYIDVFVPPRQDFSWHKQKL